MLFMTNDKLQISLIADPERTHADAITLHGLLLSANSPAQDIDIAARRLSTRLFNTITARQPRHLYVVTDERTNGIAWAMLHWPGSSEPLIELTTVSLVRLARDAPPANASAAILPDVLSVVIAAQQSEEGPLLRLEGAGAEASQIQSALHLSGIAVDDSTQVSADAVLTTLSASGAWVHIAAHGIAQPERIGYSGIWLEPSAAARLPSFISWVDVLDSSVKADLVVLNACQLGDSGTAANGSLSFADAVSRAGAKHVIAALWPVSDAAAALWVPEFYSTIVADPRHDAADGLRAAQLRLRESRAFRHPFFWAGMQVIDRMPIGSKATH